MHRFDDLLSELQRATSALSGEVLLNQAALTIGTLFSADAVLIAKNDRRPVSALLEPQDVAVEDLASAIDASLLPPAANLCNLLRPIGEPDDSGVISLPLRARDGVEIGYLYILFVTRHPRPDEREMIAAVIRAYAMRLEVTLMQMQSDATFVRMTSTRSTRAASVDHSA